MPEVLDRFIRYVQIDTQSARDSDTYPSTAKQLDLLRLLAEELKQIGMQDVRMDSYGYVTATLPANNGKALPVVGLAHVDTSPDASGANVNPRVIEHYDGGEIVLNAEENIRLSPERFPDLRRSTNGANPGNS